MRWKDLLIPRLLLWGFRCGIATHNTSTELAQLLRSHIVWFKIRFEDENVVAFRSSSLRTLSREVLDPFADNLSMIDTQPIEVQQERADDAVLEERTAAGSASGSFSSRPRRERKARTFDLSRDNGGDFSKVNPKITTKSKSPRTPLGSIKYRGVYFVTATMKWSSSININSRHISLGTFHDELDAAKVIFFM